jgi:hypothetical protein
METCFKCGNSGSVPDFMSTHTCVKPMYTYGDEKFKLEMWTVNWDGTPGDTVTRWYSSTTRNGTNKRRHDALRDLASFALATNRNYKDGTLIRPRRSDIRINSVQGVAWLHSNPARVAYFDNTEPRGA